MSYWDYAGPGLQTALFSLLIILLIAAALATFIGLLGSFMNDYMRNGIARVWWILAAIVGALVLTFGTPFAAWLHAQWFKPASVQVEFRSVDTFQEAYQECEDEGNYWYAWRQEPSDELVWICSEDELDIPQ